MVAQGLEQGWESRWRKQVGGARRARPAFATQLPLSWQDTRRNKTARNVLKPALLLNTRHCVTTSLNTRLPVVISKLGPAALPPGLLQGTREEKHRDPQGHGAVGRPTAESQSQLHFGKLRFSKLACKSLCLPYII